MGAREETGELDRKSESDGERWREKTETSHCARLTVSNRQLGGQIKQRDVALLARTGVQRLYEAT